MRRVFARNSVLTAARRAAARIALIVAIVLPLPLAAAPGKRGITEKDYLEFRFVADPQISPDGKEVAYVLVTVNQKEDRYDTSLWAVATSGGAAPRRLTAGPRDSAPRWSPDGGTLAFLRAEEKGPPQIHLLPMSGGEARKLTDLPKGTSAPAWAPSSKTLAFASATTAEDLAERDAKKQGKEVPKKSDVRIVTKAVYRMEGVGWLEPDRHAHIWTVPVTEGDGVAEAKQITNGTFDEDQISWSRNGAKILFVSNRVEEPYYFPPDTNVYAVPVAGGELETFIDIDGPINQPTASPDGSHYVFTGFVNPPTPREWTQSKLFLWEGGQAKPLTGSQDFEIGSCGSGAPRGGSPPRPLVWAPDGKSVILGVTEHGRANLVRVDVTSQRLEPLTSGNHCVVAWTATPDASKFALIVEDATHLGDIYALETATKTLTKLTGVNDELFGELNLTEPEEIWYPSFDGKQINAWIQKPPDFTQGKKYPMILQIHGGPFSAVGWGFQHMFQWMAAQGYVVLYPNPRGSTSYGQEFASIIGQYPYPPGDVYKDLMAGVDEVLKRGYVDSKRLGVAGVSYGGRMTNWTVTQTNRFAAAVSLSSAGDNAGQWYTMDHAFFSAGHAAPVQDPNKFLERSPVRYADRIETPILFIIGADDLRTPPGQGGEAMFRTLKFFKKKTAMLNFPGEGHAVGIKPAHRVERLQHTLNWFDKYLQGKPIATYDLK